jgi:hypothetical protein
MKKIIYFFNLFKLIKHELFNPENGLQRYNVY